ncbi:hypothetical protein [Ketobacter alkanivorans]|uniref:Uncharacterized protein n=1 Tax=Ketobacter alkanivorans TaxID=1917421 RepID=A0A2K9LTV2_9GAMM|nr:hypothetical protein [Ketobacter alkanivorans]AUM14254.1 hypothetical protein Kalk_18300 [Ketobacter alkanivorans]MCP5018808.1 hypothetical protein [Ketobacter sp.]
MKAIKYLILGLFVGGVLGVAAGVNIGRDQPVLSNPFNDNRINTRMKDSGSELLKQSGEAIEDAGKAIKDQFN